MLLEPKKILLVKNRALGDSVLGLSSVHYLQEIYPEAEIQYALPDWIVPLYQNIQSNKLKIVSMNSKKLKGQFNFFTYCLKEKFDVIIELNQSGSSGKILKLLSFLTSVPYFFHNHHDKKATFVIDQGKIKPNIQRDLDCIYSVAKKFFKKDIPIPNFLNYPPTIRPVKKAFKNNFAVFGVVATRETKCWPIEFYLELADLLLQNKVVEKIIIPLSNSQMDLEIEAKIKNKLSKEISILKIPLNQLADAFSGATFYVGNDTGLKHICAALEIPTLTFFGPENPLEWHPYDSAKHPYLFKENLECRTKISHFCPLTTCDSMICLNEFKPAEVLKKIQNDIINKLKS